MTLTYDKLTLFEKVLYHEAFDGQDQDDGDLIPIGYAEIDSFCGAGWFYCRDGLHYNPLFYHPAPLMDESDSASNDVEVSNEIAESIENSLPDFFKRGIEGGDRPQSAHQKTDPESFGGQHQDAAQSNDRQIDQTPTQSKFGEYWIEQQYKTIKGKTYGPYLVQRWRDKNGKKRSRYLGKAPKETAAHGQPDLGQPPHTSSDSASSSAP